MRYLLSISYDGTEFSGWQVQKERRTVQGVLEEAAEEIFSAKTHVTASGRTDVGVHALGQVAQLDGETGIPARKLYCAFNRLLPSDVRVLASAPAPDGFDCTRAAKNKTYCYRAYFAPTQQPLLCRYAARLSQRPDLMKMRRSAELLFGEHDFAAFRASGFTSKTSVRTVFGVEIGKEQAGEAEVYSIAVTGSGFLYHMVRIIAGELFAVGCGKEEGITRAFLTGERSALAKTMPPEGLVLVKVDYGAPLFGAEE